jgi:hypothetical protein
MSILVYFMYGQMSPRPYAVCRADLETLPTGSWEA